VTSFYIEQLQDCEQSDANCSQIGKRSEADREQSLPLDSKPKGVRFGRVMKRGRGAKDAFALVRFDLNLNEPDVWFQQSTTAVAKPIEQDDGENRLAEVRPLPLFALSFVL
jgi:hypothetical protein